MIRWWKGRTDKPEPLPPEPDQTVYRRLKVTITLEVESDSDRWLSRDIADALAQLAQDANVRSGAVSDMRGGTIHLGDGHVFGPDMEFTYDFANHFKDQQP